MIVKNTLVVLGGACLGCYDEYGHNMGYLYFDDTAEQAKKYWAVDFKIDFHKNKSANFEVRALFTDLKNHSLQWASPRAVEVQHARLQLLNDLSIVFLSLPILGMVLRIHPGNSEIGAI